MRFASLSFGSALSEQRLGERLSKQISKSRTPFLQPLQLQASGSSRRHSISPGMSPMPPSADTPAFHHTICVRNTFIDVETEDDSEMRCEARRRASSAPPRTGREEVGDGQLERLDAVAHSEERPQELGEKSPAPSDVSTAPSPLAGPRFRGVVGGLLCAPRYIAQSAFQIDAYATSWNACPRLPRCVQLRSKSANFGPNPVRIQPKSGRHRSTLARFGPSVPKFGTTSTTSVQCGAQSAKCGRTVADLGPSSNTFGKLRSGIEQIWPRLGQVRPSWHGIDETCSEVGRISGLTSTNFARCRTTSTNTGLASTTIGPNSVKAVRLRSQLSPEDQIRPNLT